MTYLSIKNPKASRDRKWALDPKAGKLLTVLVLRLLTLMSEQLVEPQNLGPLDQILDPHLQSVAKYESMILISGWIAIRLESGNLYQWQMAVYFHRRPVTANPRKECLITYYLAKVLTKNCMNNEINWTDVWGGWVGTCIPNAPPLISQYV